MIHSVTNAAGHCHDAVEKRALTRRKSRRLVDYVRNTFMKPAGHWCKPNRNTRAQTKAPAEPAAASEQGRKLFVRNCACAMARRATARAARATA